MGKNYDVQDVRNGLVAAVAIRVIEPELDRIWSPGGGQPVIVTLNDTEKGGHA